MGVRTRKCGLVEGCWSANAAAAGGRPRHCRTHQTGLGRRSSVDVGVNISTWCVLQRSTDSAEVIEICRLHPRPPRCHRRPGNPATARTLPLLSHGLVPGHLACWSVLRPASAVDSGSDPCIYINWRTVSAHSVEQLRHRRASRFRRDPALAAGSPLSGNGGCRQAYPYTSSTLTTHLTHQKPRRPGATSRTGAPCPVQMSRALAGRGDGEPQ